MLVVNFWLKKKKKSNRVRQDREKYKKRFKNISSVIYREFDSNVQNNEMELKS